jgi:hypothetical protein
LLSFCELEVSSESRSQLVSDFHKSRPAEENPGSHLRKGVSGDYKNKLSPETIAKVNEILKEMLDFYGYEAE